jgi:hypothetical protein
MLAALAAVIFLSGWTCKKNSASSGISDKEVVATVNGQDITFGDWMKQVDMTRVFVTPIDPTDADQVGAVLKSLIDQQLVLDKAKKARYTSSEFDELLKKKLIEADITIKEVKDRLERDMQTVKRIQKDYQDSYKRMLLARQFASNQLDTVQVTEKDMRDWYEQYSEQAKAAGQNAPPYNQLTERLKMQIKPRVQQEKFIGTLQNGIKIDRKNDVIQKYLSTLSPSQQMLESGDMSLSTGGETSSQGATKVDGAKKAEPKK